MGAADCGNDKGVCSGGRVGLQARQNDCDGQFAAVMPVCRFSRNELPPAAHSAAVLVGTKRDGPD